MLSRKEVVKRLRELGQPIKLFGESDEDTCNRLKQLEVSQLDAYSRWLVSYDFKVAMDKVSGEID